MKIQILVTPRYVSITNASYTICTVYLIIKIRNYLNLFKMATRSCAYKDCEYYYVGHENALTKGRTLFAFPKQPQRARIWHENGQVHPKIPHSQLFMCSFTLTASSYPPLRTERSSSARQCRFRTRKAVASRRRSPNKWLPLRMRATI